MSRKALIAVPMGDPAGVGPEITAKTLCSDEALESADVVVIGDGKIMQKAIEITGSPLTIRRISKPAEGDYSRGVLNLIDLDNVDMGKFAYGKVSGMCGRAAYDYIAKSIELANAREVDAVATTPINKQSLHEGGVPFIGHTEIFGKLTNTPDPLTMFETRGLRVFFLTRHVSILEMLGMIKKDRIKDYVRRCTEALRRLGVEGGTMAVAGLNPHSGERGLFGWEEVNVIGPACEEMKAEGYDVVGPSPRTPSSISPKSASSTASFLSTTTRDTSRPRPWTSSAPFPSPTACPFCARPSITVRPLISPARAKPAPSA